MNKKRILALIMVVVLVSVLIGACAAPAPAPAPTPAPAPAPAPAPPALPEINWTLGTEEASHDTWGLSPLGTMADKVSERTNGKFNIRVTIAGELGTSREEIPLIVSSGLIEMGLIPGGHVTGSIPHLGIYSLPFLVGGVEGVVPDAAKVEGATHKLTELKFGELGFATAFHYPSVPTELISKTVIEDVSDLDGLKVRAWSEATANIVKGLNGEPVIMSVSETYLALQRGVVDAVMTGVSSGMIPCHCKKSLSIYISSTWHLPTSGLAIILKPLKLCLQNIRRYLVKSGRMLKS